MTFVYTGSRDGSILGRVLEGFRGVLVSDFYAAYDSVPCAQQKCLVHLIRDMNDDLFRNQLDADLRDLVQTFSGVLKPIILTIDEHGLKRRQLRKHKESVEEFLDDLAVRDIGARDSALVRHQSQPRRLCAVACRVVFIAEC